MAGTNATYGAASESTPLKYSADRVPPLQLTSRTLRAEVLETMLYDCAKWSPRACHYYTLQRAHHSFLTGCIGWRKNNRVDDLIPSSGHAYQNGRYVHRGNYTQEWTLFAGFVARIEDASLSKCVMFGELLGDTVCLVCFLDNLRAFGISMVFDIRASYASYSFVVVS